MSDVCHHWTQLAVTTGQIETFIATEVCVCVTLYNLLEHVKIVPCIFYLCALFTVSFTMLSLYCHLDLASCICKQPLRHSNQLKRWLAVAT